MSGQKTIAAKAAKLSVAAHPINAPGPADRVVPKKGQSKLAQPGGVQSRSGQFYIVETDQTSSSAAGSSPAPYSAVGDDHTRLGRAILCAELREHHRARSDMMGAEQRITLQAKSICRRLAGGTKEGQALYTAVVKNEEHPLGVIAAANIGPMLEAREPLTAEKKRRERILKKVVKELPVWEEFAEPINGFGPLGLAMIIGESGPLDNYSNESKLWKRFGLAVINGERQRRMTGQRGIEQGYSPLRRSLMYVIGDALTRKANKYRDARDARKVIETERAEAKGLIVLPAAQIPKAEAHLYMSVGHIHNRANRYVQKRLLRDLWRAW